MPLTRYHIRNEYGLADSELYRAADRDDSEAVLEGVAMAGLVGVLRQLGDLAEFAAEIFYHLHEEVTATAARGRGLMSRVQQLETEFPSIEKVFLSQTNHTSFFAYAGVDWHPNLHSKQNVISTHGDLPRFVMDSYEECRGPPRLFLLDKFDVAGAGACLKRYTDPSFFKVETASMKVQREKRSRKVKRKGPRARNGEAPEVVPTSHAKLHQLFLEECVENGYSDPARIMILKRRQLDESPFGLKNTKSYMEKFFETQPDHKLVSEVPFTPPPLKVVNDNSGESWPYMVDLDTVSPFEELSHGKKSPCSSPNAHAIMPVHPSDENYDDIDKAIARIPDLTIGYKTYGSSCIIHDAATKGALDRDPEDKTDGSPNAYDIASEVDNYMDALTIMQSETETDSEYKPKNYNANDPLNVKNFLGNDVNGEELDIQANLSDSMSTANHSSDDEINLSKKGRYVFSKSNSFGNLAESFTPDEEGAPQVFCSGEGSLAPHADLQSHNGTLPTKPLDAIPKEDALFIGYCKTFVNPDPEEASCCSSPTDSRNTLQPLFSAPADTLEGLPSEVAKLQSKLLDREINRISFPDSSAVILDISPQTSHDSATASSESHHVNESDQEDEKFFSDTFIQMANMLKLGHEKRRNDDSINRVLQTKKADEVSSENLGKRDSVLEKEEQFSCSTSAKVEVDSGTALSLKNINSDALISIIDNSSSKNNGLPAITLPSKSSDVLKPYDLVTEVDHNFKTESIIGHGYTDRLVSQVEADFSEVPSCEEKSKLEEVSDSSVIWKIEKITGNTYVVEGNTVASISSYFLDKENLDHQLQDYNSATESIQEGNVGLSSEAATVVENRSDSTAALAVDAVSDGVEPSLNITASPLEISLTKLQKSLYGPECGLRKDLGSEESVSLESTTEIHSEMEPKQLEARYEEHSPDLYKLFPKSNSKEREQDDSPSTDEQVQNNTGINEVIIAQCSAPYYEEMQSKSSYQNRDIPSCSFTCYKPGVATSLDQSMQMQGGTIDSDYLEVDELSLKSLDLHASPTYYIHEPGSSMESSLELQYDSPTKERLLSCEAKPSPNFLVSEWEQLCNPSYTDQERYSNVPPKSCSEELSSQSKSSQSKSGMLFRNPFVSSFPDFDILPGTTASNPEGMPKLSPTTKPEGTPPMPPLPPIQWRLGKVQHAGLPVEKGRIGDTFPHLQSSKGHENSLSDFASLNAEIAQPPNPFLFPNVSDTQRLESLSAESTEISNSLSLESQTIVNDPDNLHNIDHLEAKKSLNPYLTSQSMPKDGLRQGLFASTGGPTQSGPNRFSPATTLEDKLCKDELTVSTDPPLSPLNEKAPETALETKTAKDNSQNLEEEQTSSGKNSVPTSVLKAQLEHDLSTSLGEMVSPPSKLGLPMTYEVGKITGTKLSHTRNPVIDAAAALDKSKLRRATERVQPQIKPKEDERDSFLEQIRTKPASMTRIRPRIQSIEGPKTNLKVAAILEKANARRQALAGSDDDDTDSWSDS